MIARVRRLWRIKVVTCGRPFFPPTFIDSHIKAEKMLPIHSKIDRAQRLVRMLEQDAPLLAVRVEQLTPEYQQSAKNYAARLTAHARAELEKLVQEKYFSDWNETSPQAAD
jgi:hypothetical protein